MTLRQTKPFSARIILPKTPCHFSLGDATKILIILTGCHYHPNPIHTNQKKKTLDTVSPLSCKIYLHVRYHVKIEKGLYNFAHLLTTLPRKLSLPNYKVLSATQFCLLQFSLLPKSDKLQQFYFTRFICTQCVFPQVTPIIISRYDNYC